MQPLLFRFNYRFLSVLLVVVYTLVPTVCTAATNEPVEILISLSFAGEPKTDPETKFKALIESSYAKILAVSEKPGVTAVVSAEWVDTKQINYPSLDAFKYATRDASIEMATYSEVLKSKRTFYFRIKAVSQNLIAANRYACALIADLADATGGIVWDEECRLFYSSAMWRKDRVESWENGIPDVRTHINMHAYRDPELVRVITLGMRKFGLPDLVVDSLPSNHTRPGGNAINACAQLLLEGNKAEKGLFDLNLSQIRHKQGRESALENPGKGAKGKIQIRLSPTAREDGDPDNALLKLEFPNAAGSTYTEKQLAAYAELFGSTDKIKNVSHGDPAMKAASEKARKAFFAKEASFRNGLELNEHLLIKTEFIAAGETEYMWVEITKWNKDSVDGTLSNDSFYDASLRAGKRVTIKLSEVYDYILYKPDGKMEGNETGKVLEAIGK